MKWDILRRSSNVEDRRGSGGPLVIGGGIGATILALIIYFLGGDPSVITGGRTEPPQSAVDAGDPARKRADDPLADFSSRVLGSTEDVWSAIFREQGSSYAPPNLVLFTQAVRSACGTAGAAVGPFYCPGDRKLYVDLSFYSLLKDRLGAPGDFAQAYVIAHEVGHHVQNLTGSLGRADQMKAQARSQAEANKIQVRVELQADCYAGVWAQRVGRQGNILEQGDEEEAINAASRIGDDVLQSEAQGRVVPDAFTHGSAAQRREWLQRGMREGTMGVCDTFAGDKRSAERAPNGAGGGF